MNIKKGPGAMMFPCQRKEMDKDDFQGTGQTHLASSIPAGGFKSLVQRSSCTYDVGLVGLSESMFVRPDPVDAHKRP